MTGNIVARRYAKALFAIGAKKGEADAYGKDLASLAAVVKASPELKKVFATPVFGAEQKKAVLDKILEKIKVGLAVKNFSSLLADKGRLSYLPEIQAVYASLLDEAQGVLRGKLVTAIKLPEKRQTEIKAKLEAQTGHKLVLGFDVDTNILGGLVLHVGDKVLDASLRAQLSILKENIRRGE